MISLSYFQRQFPFAQSFDSEAAVNRCSSKYVFLNILQVSQENTFVGMSVNKVAGLQLYQKETSTQLFSCEICKIFKNTFFYRTPPMAVSVNFAL